MEDDLWRCPTFSKRRGENTKQKINSQKKYEGMKKKMNRPNNDIFLTRGRGARARARAKIKVISEKSSSGEFREWRRGAPPPPPSIQGHLAAGGGISWDK